jgi:hypothetical protein
MSSLRHLVLACAFLLLAAVAHALQPTRRALLGGALSIPLASFGIPSIASAGIDVSSLRVEGQAGSNAVLRDQLKAYDGSATTRVQEIKAAASVSTTKSPPVSVRPDTEATAPGGASVAATFALRYGDYTRLTKLGFGDRFRLDDYVVGPGNSKLSVSFEFPSDWLQLDRLLGGIQYVDQRNGDKLYLLRATLPEGTTLESVPKNFFGQVIFDTQGSISRGGTTIDEYKVGQSNMVADGRRRLVMKYATVTGNGLRVERRALVDAYQVGRDVYMLMTSSNAVKFDKKGIERETVDAICGSFRVDKL